MKVIIHPTWACQFRCSYCSVHARGLEKDPRTLHWRRWADWIRQLPASSTIEISGGEPLLYRGLIDLLRAIVEMGLGWGLTTNAAHSAAVEALAGARLAACAGLNVSIQPESPLDILERAALLREAGYPVRLNWVDHPGSPPFPSVRTQVEFHVNRIPYQAWLEGGALDTVRRVCSAGSSHLCCDPVGRVYRCLVHLQLGIAPLGTIAAPLTEVTLRGLQPCDTGCSTCYTTMPESWGLKMKGVQ